MGLQAADQPVITWPAMCGRYTLSTPGAAVAELLELETAPQLAPRYNIAPTQESAVVRLA